MKRFLLALSLCVVLPWGAEAQITPTNTFGPSNTVSVAKLNTNFTDLGSAALNRNNGTILGNITMAAGITIGGVNIAGKLCPTCTPTFAAVVASTFTGTLVGSASTLTTPRAINGVDFDGSAAITVTAAAGTLSGATLASGVTASSLTSVGTLTSFTTSGNISLTDADVVHGMTGLAATTVYGQLAPISGTIGGLFVMGLSDDDATAVNMRAVIGAADPTDATPAYTLEAGKKNGTTWQALAAAETAFKLYNYSAALLTIMGNGDATLAGGLSATTGSFSSSLSLTDVDVAHGMTALAATSVYGQFSPVSGTAGGLFMMGLSDTDANAIGMRAVIGSSNPTDSVPAYMLEAGKYNGTGWQALAAAETAFKLYNYSTPILTVLGNGDTTVAGTFTSSGFVAADGALYVNHGSTSGFTYATSGDKYFSFSNTSTNTLYSGSTQFTISNQEGTQTLLSLTNAGVLSIGRVVQTTSTNSAWAMTLENAGTTDAHGLYVNIGAASTGTPFLVAKNAAAFLAVGNTGLVTLSANPATYGLIADGSNGLGIAATHGSGALRFYSGGTAQRAVLTAAGNWVLGSGTAITDLVGAPTIASGFGTGATIAGTNYAFAVTLGTGASSGGTINFSASWTNAPVCSVLTNDVQHVAADTTTDAINIIYGSVVNGGLRIMVICRGY